MDVSTEPWGYEDDTVFHVMQTPPDAPAPLIEGMDPPPSQGVMDQPAILVNKATGEVELVPVVGSFERLEAMTPVGTGHPED